MATDMSQFVTFADLEAMDFLNPVAYNGTNAAGGDSLTDNLNVYYNV